MKKKFVNLQIVFLLLSACQGQIKGSHMKDLDISMILSNSDGPFITRNLSIKIAMAVIDDKYPKNIFVPSDDMDSISDGDFWIVSVSNKINSGIALNSPYGKRISFKIRKSNGEIEKIS